jgi:hypothetical protein
VGVRYSPKSIVTDGLVFCVDAGNPKSYPGSGTTWFDIIGSGSSNGVLTGGPTYSSSGGGSISFDGIDDYCTTNNTFSTLANNLFADSGGSWSVSAWFNFPVSPAGSRTGNSSWMIIGRGGGIGTGATFGVFIGSATDTTFGQYAPYYCACVIRGSVTVISPSSVNDGIWHSVTTTWNGSSGKVYFDASDMGSINAGTAVIQTVNVSIGTSGGGTLHPFDGLVSTCLIYNRSLTSEEILYNFNISRTRFGV